MIRRSALIGLALGGVAGTAIGVAYVRHSRPPAATEPPPAWPPLVVDDVDEAPSASATDPVVDDTDADVVVAPGPDPQPERPPADDGAAERSNGGAPAAALATDVTLQLDAIDSTGGVCPPTHPIKGKLSSRIAHVPGFLNYDRTKADRCYVDVAAAERDGMRIAKR